MHACLLDKRCRKVGKNDFILRSKKEDIAVPDPVRSKVQRAASRQLQHSSLRGAVRYKRGLRHKRTGRSYIHNCTCSAEQDLKREHFLPGTIAQTAVEHLPKTRHHDLQKLFLQSAGHYRRFMQKGKRLGS